MAQDGGVDPHNIAVAHGFLDRFRGRPESSCILEVPDRIERSIAELQSAAFAAWLRNLMVRKVRFELTRPFGHQGLSLTRLPFRHMRKYGGPGRTRTFGVSDVTGLQPAGFAAYHTDPYGCGGGNRTLIYRLMRPVSYQLTTPHYCPAQGWCWRKDSDL